MQRRSSSFVAMGARSNAAAPRDQRRSEIVADPCRLRLLARQTLARRTRPVLRLAGDDLARGAERLVPPQAADDRVLHVLAVGVFALAHALLVENHVQQLVRRDL